MITDAAKAIRDAIQNKITDIHTAVFGEVQEYDPVENVATVLPLATSYINGQYVDYPTLYNVPVAMQKSGDISITFPVAKGDIVLLLFMERSLNRWTGDPDRPLLSAYSLNNAIAIPGFAYGLTGKEEEASADKKLIIANGETSIEIRSDKVVINGDLQVTGSIN